jgi:hypothetical protein
MLTPMFLSVGSTTATVKRYGQGSYLHGRWVDGAETTFTITANIQPHTVKNISDTTAEGNKSKKAIKVFTTTTLRMTQEGTALQNGDKILWHSELYEVSELYTYEMGVLNHTMVIAIRDEVNG